VSVALKLLLQYNGKLHGRHVGNASGSGTGARPGCLVEAAADPAATRLDDGGLAAVVLEKVAAKNLG
jgi:hypothetical protein